MSDIEQLQQRITAAMDRVAYGLSQMETGGPGEVAALKAALEEERTVSAQLEERVSALKLKLEDSKAAADSARAALQEKVGAMDLEMQKLRQANDKLREANQALREANQNGVGNAHLINMSIVAELDSLRAARALERAETEAILAALAPALAEDGTGDDTGDDTGATTEEKFDA
jgi:chromosome segregation ATPase